MRRGDVAVDDPDLFIQSVREQCKLEFPSVEIPVSIFYQLNCLRPRPYVILFNQLFTAIPLSPLLLPSPISGYSIGIVANCYCRLGRVDFGFSLLGRHLKLGFPLDVVVINTLLNGLITSDKLQPAVQMTQ
ncbi:hypothetical protein RND81_12G068200 [Saponaria officinalis]|uniref:Uncharacterized protein n=1 Tax=Saponaria officinalis TaxID=3572 RepID=A0AAW1H7G6_SAPOF